jgi:mannose-6-phosphate isomerase-like protein (cupin superfamily)
MQRFIIGPVGVALMFVQSVGFSQSKQPPVLATDITAAEVKAVLDSPPGTGDRLITAADMGAYNVGVGVLRRNATKPGAPVGAVNHEQITEVYYIISGTGTLVTGGTVTNERPMAATSDIVKVVVGPSNTATFEKPAQRRKVGPGDVVIIPPGVYHGFDDVTTSIDYLAVRPDPNKVLPAGYLHPAVQAARGSK